jgi:hypothetical protein
MHAAQGKQEPADSPSAVLELLTSSSLVETAGNRSTSTLGGRSESGGIIPSR